jgi:quercetin dioxygenase-like cupin family protein
MGERIKGRTLVARDEGDDADGVLIKLYGEETNGAVSIIEQPFAPGLLLPPHVHQNDVWLYVLEGEMHAWVGDEVVKAAPGCWVLKPRRVPYTMWNAGPEPPRIIELYTPGGFELVVAVSPAGPRPGWVASGRRGPTAGRTGPGRPARRTGPRQRRRPCPWAGPGR